MSKSPSSCPQTTLMSHAWISVIGSCFVGASQIHAKPFSGCALIWHDWCSWRRLFLWKVLKKEIASQRKQQCIRKEKTTKLLQEMRELWYNIVNSVWFWVTFRMKFPLHFVDWIFFFSSCFHLKVGWNNWESNNILLSRLYLVPLCRKGLGCDMSFFKKSL